jgi:hypothetical protein
MTKEEFYKDLGDAISQGCSLPFNIPQKSLDIIVKYAKEWFYRNWEDALENVYILLPREQWINDKNFKDNRGIVLPSCIYSVNSVCKDQGSLKKNMLGMQPISDYNNFTWGVGSYGSTEDGMQSDAVLGYIIASSWNDLNYSLFKYPISYNYNRNTNRLFLKGSVQENPDFILDCDIRIPEEGLFREDLFFNYCRGEAMRSLSNILGTFEMELPGNAKINYDRLESQGEKIVEEVKEEVKGMSSGSAFILTSGNGI